MTTTVDPRTAILSDLCHPEYNPVSESHGLSHDDAVKLVDAYRAKVLREAADFFRGLSVTGTTITTQEAEAELRRMADEAEAQDG